MSAKSKRQEDAESIVGRDNAEALEVEDQKLVGRTSTSDIDPLAVVERKHKGDDDEYEADDAVDEDDGLKGPSQSGHKARERSHHEV